MIELQARYQQSEDLILLGAYKAGTNRDLDKAVGAQDGINAFLRQDIDAVRQRSASRSKTCSLW